MSKSSICPSNGHLTDFRRLVYLKRSHARMSSLVSTPLQEGQRKMSCSARTPSLGIARSSFMVSPHERHTSVGVSSGTGGGRSIEVVEGV
jgi:hypothetical protein